MLKTARRPAKVRVQVDLTSAEAALLRVLEKRLSVRSRADLLQQAYGAFLWITDEMLAGRRIVSLEVGEMTRLVRFKELALPAVAPAVFNHYRYLIPRPERGRGQLYLKGRNMSVGQLVYDMRANHQTAQHAAEDRALPLDQVLEALAYYESHREVVDSEMAEEKQHLLAAGVRLEPETLP